MARFSVKTTPTGVELISETVIRSFTHGEFLEWVTILLPKVMDVPDQGVGIDMTEHVMVLKRAQYARFKEDMEALCETIRETYGPPLRSQSGT